ncbi:MAG: alpha/beta hydrolase [Chloroflexi bacterium AL-W]|nr:alpha/beta hydrolase [Chloroflexi bacterium AL-N1]NOK65117.1 alpha/beta hydrolase [Chloroflexi bacterium AL-N10]NOK72616.1 alpha/beta hydrolase [Chloroflexi bacterium AL-N5]NOK79296.1 alpha/beta hydrolase [Chloroflexi bacterium AL-W]NOK87212.1 alpha/beta hydrolase [Chloroflexi bacterium AL-N15]
MSIMVIDRQVVHYEVFGQGQPVLFLHGWLGSWRYWYPTIEHVSEHFRAYSFDFWGFGESRRQQTQASIQNYSDQVIRFLDEMGIDKVTLIGHSMGGMVALKTAINHPKRIGRVAAVGAPIVGDSLSWLLKLTDRPVMADAFARVNWLRRYMFRLFLGETNDPAVHEILDDSVKSSSTTLRRAVGSMWRTDLRPELSRLIVPSLIVHGGRDEIVHPNQADLFEKVPAAQVVVMPESRHFPFLDEPELFNDILIRFLKQSAPQHLMPRVPVRQPKPVRPAPSHIPSSNSPN